MAVGRIAQRGSVLLFLALAAGLVVRSGKAARRAGQVRRAVVPSGNVAVTAARDRDVRADGHAEDLPR